MNETVLAIINEAMYLPLRHQYHTFGDPMDNECILYFSNSRFIIVASGSWLVDPDIIHYIDDTLLRRTDSNSDLAGNIPRYLIPSIAKLRGFDPSYSPAAVHQFLISTTRQTTLTPLVWSTFVKNKTQEQFLSDLAKCKDLPISYGGCDFFHARPLKKGEIMTLEYLTVPPALLKDPEVSNYHDLTLLVQDLKHGQNKDLAKYLRYWCNNGTNYAKYFLLAEANHPMSIMWSNRDKMHDLPLLYPGRILPKYKQTPNKPVTLTSRIYGKFLVVLGNLLFYDKIESQICVEWTDDGFPQFTDTSSPYGEPSPFLFCDDENVKVVLIYNAKTLAKYSCSNLFCRADWPKLDLSRFKLDSNCSRYVELFQIKFPDLAHLHKKIPVDALPLLETKSHPYVFVEKESTYFSLPLEDKIRVYIKNREFIDKLTNSRPFDKFDVVLVRGRPIQPKQLFLFPDELWPEEVRDILPTNVEFFVAYNRLPNEKKRKFIEYNQLGCSHLTNSYFLNIVYNDGKVNWLPYKFSQVRHLARGTSFHSCALFKYNFLAKGFKLSKYGVIDDATFRRQPTNFSLSIKCSSNSITPAYLDKVEKGCIMYNPTRMCFTLQELEDNLRAVGNKGFGEGFPDSFTMRELRQLLFLLKYVREDSTPKSVIERLEYTIKMCEINININFEKEEERTAALEWMHLFWTCVMVMRRWVGENTPLPITTEQTLRPVDPDEHTTQIMDAFSKMIAHPLHPQMFGLKCYKANTGPLIVNGKHITLQQRVDMMLQTSSVEACIRLTSNVLLYTFYFWLDKLFGIKTYQDKSLQDFDNIS